MIVSPQYIPEIKIPYPQQENPTIRKVKVLTELGLPFLSLYKPASSVLSYGTGILGVTQGVKGLVGSENRVQSAVAVAKGVADIATTYFQNRALMIASGMVELTQGIHNLYVAPPKERMTHVVKCLTIAIHLAAQVHQSTPQWMILSLIIQALSSFYHAYLAYLPEKKTEDFQWEKALTGVAKTVMGLIRLYQAHELYEGVKLRKEVEEFIASEEEELITSEVIEDGPVGIKSGKVLSGNPSGKLSQIVEDESDHPLKNLVQQIEAKRVVFIDPVTGNKYDFGAYFHGYGNRLVKGSNLRFNHKVTKDGSVVTELMFKVNRFYQSHMQQKIEQLELTSPQVDTELEYSMPKISAKNHIEMVQGVKELLFSKLADKSDRLGLKVKDVGSLEIQPSLVKVEMAGDRGIKDFQRFLSAFGLDEAVHSSSVEDIEKIKLGFLFKFFNPLEAYKLQEEPSFANFTLDEMKQKMISKAPAMENYLNKYQVQPIELLPGYVRYSIPIDAKVYELGGRALTAIITRGKSDDNNRDKGEREIPTDLPKNELERLANIVKHGMFSEEMRISNNVYQGGLGGNESVFTQMVWEMDVKDRKKLEKMGYAREGIVRLYFSLKALNRGSYQYNRDLLGVRKGAVYKLRKNIIDFITSFPFWSSEARYCHEFMLPDRILPEEIQGMSVPSEYMKEQLLDYYRKYQIIQVDALGVETINGIAAHAFISVEPRIPVDIIQRCGRPEELRTDHS